MLILPRTVSKAEKRILELVDALTDKTSPCCSGHVRHNALLVLFLFFLVSQLMCRRFTECRD